MRTLFRILRNQYAKYKELWELNKYDRFTIAEYFRKQGAQVGEGCSIIPTSLGTEPYLVKIGNRVTIATGVAFITHDGGAWLFRDEVPDIQIFGPIVIEDDCVIGANAMLLPNIRIGRKSIVGAGSVVISDIPPESIAVGVPARVFGSIHRYREKCLTRWEMQKPPDVEIEPGTDWWHSGNFESNVKKLREHLCALFWEGKTT